MAMSVAIGMTTAATIVVRQFFKKQKMTPTDKSRPMMMLSTTPEMDSRTKMDWS